MKDVTCPYCGHEMEVCRDDGFACEEDILYRQECPNCEKEFVLTVEYSWSYSSFKADCLNGGEHKWRPLITCPKEYTQMRCDDCGEERQPTEEEWEHIKEKK